MLEADLKSFSITQHKFNLPLVWTESEDETPVTKENNCKEKIMNAHREWNCTRGIPHHKVRIDMLG